jgi:DNA-binding SARP family transcriptional activator
MLRFKLLGPLDVVGDEDVTFTPTAPRVLNTLALLLIRAGHVVPLETIIEELWDEDPPRSAARTAQTYVYQIRRWLNEEAGGAEEMLVTRPPGYLLRLDRGQLDVNDFEDLLDLGRSRLADDGPEEATRPLCEALSLWSGPALANIQLGRVLAGYATALEEQRNRALNLRIEADLRLGRHRELIGELRSLVTANPYDEWYHSLLVCALANAGRRYDALQAYRAARDILAEDLGLSPCPELCDVHAAVLHGDRPEIPLSIA